MALHEVIYCNFVTRTRMLMINSFLSSNLLSNDTQMRCNFVDLYYALYGIKRPAILSAPETSSITSSLPRIPKLSDKRRSESPCEAMPQEIKIIESNSREVSQVFKREPSLNIDDDHCSIIKEEQSEIIKVVNFDTNNYMHSIFKLFIILIIIDPL